MNCCLVLITSASIQGYIFDTNKRRENVGASHLVASVGTWATDALGELVPGWQHTARIRDDNRPDVVAAEMVTDAAGSAKVLVTHPAVAKKLVSAVTRRALLKAPGLNVCGVFVEFDWAEPGAAAKADAKIHELLPQARDGRPGPASRFARLPLVDRCTSSGLPASRLYDETSGSGSSSGENTDGENSDAEPPEWTTRSRTSMGKLAAADEGYKRLAGITATDGQTPKSSKNQRDARDARDGLEAVADYLERRADWVAVVHADGNGLGEVVKAYRTRLADKDNRRFVNGMRAFSMGIDAAARDSYRLALATLWTDPSVPRVRRKGKTGDNLPVLPLVLGGDDLTVVCDGAAALGFTAAYLRHFEERTEALLRDLNAGETASEGGGDAAGEAGGTTAAVVAPTRLSASAGIAIVKAHYPFSAAYRLAEDLMAEAKTVKRAVASPASALSFHVLHDNTAVALDDLRDRQTTDDGRSRLVAQPYVVTGPRDGWATHRHWDDLLRRVAALRAFSASSVDVTSVDATSTDANAEVETDIGGARLLPRSQTHRLRDALFEGRETADARFELVGHRYAQRGLFDLTVQGSLFWPEPAIGPGDGQPPPRMVTGLLDAMDAEPFVGHRADREGAVA